MATRRRYPLYRIAALALLAAACRPPGAAPVPERSAPVMAPPSPTPSASTAPAPTPSTPVPAASSGPAPLLEPTPLVTLPVEGFRDAVVSVPLGAREPRPIVLALHGNFDRPEWQCQVWRRITQGEVFVLCPRGIPRRDVPQELDRWEWGSLTKTRAELLAAIAALRARYPEHARPGKLVFTGFSLGAILGARLIRDPELEVGAAVLIEGGYQGWNRANAQSLAPHLKALLFACGQTDCRNAYRYQLEPLLERAGVSASMVADVKAGHTYDDPLAALIRAEWPGLLERFFSE